MTLPAVRSSLAARVLLFLPILSGASLQAQTTWHVATNGNNGGAGAVDDPWRDIQFALEAAEVLDGDTIQIAPGTYTEALNTNGKAVTVAGAGSDLTVLDASGLDSAAVTLTSGEDLTTLFEDLKVIPGAGVEIDSLRYGAGFYLQGSRCTLLRVTVQGGEADEGVGVYAPNGIEMYDCRVLEGRGCRGVGVSVQGPAAFHRCTFEGARMGFTPTILNCQGGGMLASGPVQIERCIFRDNRDDPLCFDGSQGGGLYADSSVTTIDSLFESNYACFYGGGGFAGNYFGCVFRDNNSQFGAGVAGFSSQPAILTDCLLAANEVLSDGSITEGGGAYGAHLTACMLRDNFAENGGGAQHSVLQRCLVEGNVAGTRGGGLQDSLAEDCLIRGNTAEGLPATDPGGGAGAAGSDLNRCLVLENRLTAGGFFNTGAGLRDCTASFTVVAGNQSAGRGGGAAQCDLLFCTVTDNTAMEPGGGIDAYKSVASASGCIVWGNTPDQMGEFPISLEVTDSCVQGGWPGAGNISSDPLFWLAGSSPYKLQAGSPCIGAADGQDMGAHVFDALYQP